MIVHGHVRPGERALARGQSVVLVEYDGDRGLFLVVSADIAGNG
jgi:hypothetical protein